jgi:L-seryl-tRNA(Ser) seleniumtransferase
MLILAGLAAGREVVISRGELVEIGGGFRIPDVMRQSGALLREVGTTNRTRVTDYLASVSAATAMFLRVHPSNFRIEGFTERPALADLVGLARETNVPIVEDIGSGCLAADLAGEPSVQASIAAGVDLVCFSGDKLLGGPQCGIIAGRAALVDRLRTHPLMRALRADKITFRDARGHAVGIQRRTGGIDDPGATHAAPFRRGDRDASAGARRNTGRERLARRTRQRLVRGRRRQRARAGIADGVAVDREGRRIGRCRPNAGCDRSIRRSSPASNATSSSWICDRAAGSRTRR